MGVGILSFFRINFSRCVFFVACVKRHAQPPPFSSPLILSLVNMTAKIWCMKKEHLLISGVGKYPEYNYYRVTGMATDDKPKGSHEREAEPVNVRSLLP